MWNAFCRHNIHINLFSRFLFWMNSILQVHILLILRLHHDKCILFAQYARLRQRKELFSFVISYQALWIIKILQILRYCIIFKRWGRKGRRRVVTITLNIQWLTYTLEFHTFLLYIWDINFRGDFLRKKVVVCWV